MNKGLEALDYIMNTDYVYNEEDYLHNRDIIEKELQALEIIKKKGIDIGWLRQCDTVESYNFHCEAEKLTQEEFELLKEVLCNG